MSALLRLPELYGDGGGSRTVNLKNLSGPISRDNAILSLRYPIARCLLREVSTSPIWCDSPLWYLVSHRRISVIPHFATYRTISVRYPIKTSTEEFAILALQASRDMKSIAAGARASQGPDCEMTPFSPLSPDYSQGSRPDRNGPSHRNRQSRQNLRSLPPFAGVPTGLKVPHGVLFE